MYETSDLAFTAYLLCKGHNVVKVTKKGPKIFFHIEPDLEEDFRNKFYFDMDTVPAYSYYQKIRMLKAQIYDKGD